MKFYQSSAVALALGLLSVPVMAQNETIQEPAQAETIASQTDGEASGAEMLLMTPNAEVVFITTGGAESRADWSATATENFVSHFQNHLETFGLTVLNYNSEDEISPELEQLMLLEEVVNESLFLNIPHKPGKGLNNTDLTLGSTAAMLKEAYGTDKALFVNHYSQIESSGVFLLAVAVGTATGYTPPSQNLRFTRGTVFDLETGDMLSTQSHLFGDPRSVSESENITRNVMKGLNLAEVS